MVLRAVQENHKERQCGCNARKVPYIQNGASKRWVDSCNHTASVLPVSGAVQVLQDPEHREEYYDREFDPPRARQIRKVLPGLHGRGCRYRNQPALGLGLVTEPACRVHGNFTKLSSLYVDIFSVLNVVLDPILKRSNGDRLMFNH